MCPPPKERPGLPLHTIPHSQGPSMHASCLTGPYKRVTLSAFSPKGGGRLTPEEASTNHPMSDGWTTTTPISIPVQGSQSLGLFPQGWRPPTPGEPTTNHPMSDKLTTTTLFFMDLLVGTPYAVCHISAVLGGSGDFLTPKCRAILALGAPTSPSPPGSITLGGLLKGENCTFPRSPPWFCSNFAHEPQAGRVSYDHERAPNERPGLPLRAHTTFRSLGAGISPQETVEEGHPLRPFPQGWRLPPPEESSTNDPMYARTLNTSC